MKRALIFSLLIFSSIWCLAQPVNDECAAAIDIPVSTSTFCHSTSVHMDVSGATQSNIPAICHFPNDDDTWYKFTAINDIHTLRIYNVSDPNFTIENTVFESMTYILYEGNCNSLNEKYCTSSIAYECVLNNNTFKLVDLTPGETYYLNIYSTSTSLNNYSYDICIETPPEPPCNDVCMESIELPITDFGKEENALSGTTFYANPSIINGSCDGKDRPDVWYNFTADAEKYLIRISDLKDAYTKDKIDPWFCDYNTIIDIEVYEGSCGNLTCVTNEVRDSLLQLSNLNIGSDYYINVSVNPHRLMPQSGWTNYTPNADFFDFNIGLIRTDINIENNECSNPDTLTISTGGVKNFERYSTIGATASLANADEEDIWFEFVATDTAHLLSVTNFSIFAGQRIIYPQSHFLNIEVYEGSCGSLTLVDDLIENQTISNLLIGTKYLIRIFTENPNLIVSFDIAISEYNDNRDCQNAIGINVNPWNTCENNVSPGFIYGGTGWYKFTAINSAVIISLQDPTSCSQGVCFNSGKEKDFYVNINLEVFSGNCSGLNYIYQQNAAYHKVAGLTVGQEYYVRVLQNSDLHYENICVRMDNSITNDLSCIASASPSANSVQTFSGQLFGEIWHKFRIGNYSPNHRYVNFEFINYADTETLESFALENFTYSLYQEYGSDCDSLITIAENIDVRQLAFDRLNDEKDYYIKLKLNEGSLLSSYISYQLKVSQSAYPANEPVTGTCSNPPLLTGFNPCTTILLGKGNCTFRASDFSLDADDDSFFKFQPYRSNCEIVLTDQNDTSVEIDKDIWIEVFDLNSFNQNCSSTNNYLLEPLYRGEGPRFSVNGLDTLAQYVVRTYSKGYGEADRFFYKACVKYLEEDNDECLDAKKMEVSSSNCENSGWFDTKNMSQSMSACKGEANDDIWFKFKATSSELTFELSGMNCDDSNSLNSFVTEVYEGGCNNLNSIHCDSLNSFNISGLTPQQEYYFRVYSYLNDYCEFNLCIKDENINYNPQLKNDLPAQASVIYQAPIDITENDCLSDYKKEGTFYGSTSSGTGYYFGSGINNDVWYEFNANSNEVRFDMDGSTGSSLLVYDENFNFIVSSDSLNITDTYSFTSNGFVVGQKYFIKLLVSFQDSTHQDTIMRNSSVLNFELCLKGLPSTDPQGGYTNGVVLLPLPSSNSFGYTEGNFSVSYTGAAEYTIPFSIPTGVTGMRPEIGISYNSSGGKGILGEKFSLAGISMIARVGQTIIHDDNNIPVTFSDLDRFSLDGQRLIAAGTIPYGADGQTYRTEINSFSKITSNGSILNQNSPESFTVNTRDGLTYEYGHTKDSRIEATGRRDVMFWLVNKIKDTKGNAIKFNYTEEISNGYFYIESIEYTFNEIENTLPNYKIKFIYENRPDVDISYVHGSMIKKEKRLKSIHILFNNTETRSYHLTYTQDNFTQDSKLVNFQECGLNGECLNPTIFEWEPSIDFSDISKRIIYNPIVKDSLKWHVSYTPHEMKVRYEKKRRLIENKIERTYQLFFVEEFSILAQDIQIDADINGDGLIDILIHNRTDSKLTAFKNSGDYDFQQEQILLNNIITTFNASTGNLEKHNRSAHPCCGDGTTEGTVCCEEFYRNGFVRPLDINADGFIDLMVYDTVSGTNAWYINTGSKDFQNLGFTLQMNKINKVNLKRTSNENRYPSFTDLNGDGYIDMTIVGANGFRKTYLNTNPTKTLLGHNFTEVAVSAPTEVFSESTFFGDFNYDGKQDVFYINETTGETRIYKNTSGNLPTLSVSYVLDKVNPIQLEPITYNGPFVKVADFNGDRLLDLYVVKDGNGGYSRVYLNKGDYLFDLIENNEVDNYPFSIPAASPMDLVNDPIDVNGDGSADLVSFTASTGEFFISINRGDGVFKNNPRTYNGDLDNFIEKGLIGGGSGLKLINYKRGNLFAFSWSNILDGSNLIFDLDFDQRSKDIQKIINGNGQVIDIKYDFINNEKVYERECINNYPEFDFIGNQKVVSDFKVYHGEKIIADESHFYKYGKIDVTGRGMLGFREFHTTNNLKGTKKILYRHTDYKYRASSTNKIELISPNGTLLSSSEYDIQLDSITLASGKSIVQSYPKEIIERSFEIDGSPISVIKKRKKINEYGNAEYTLIDFGNGYIDSTHNTYSDDLDNWYLGRLTKSSVFRTTPDSTVQRDAEFEYDPVSFLLKKEITEPEGGNNKVEKEYFHDAYGNITQSSLTAWSGNAFETRNGYSTYDANGLFQTKNQNDLGHTSHVHLDNPLGLKSKVIDPNGNTVHYEYDEMGRVKNTSLPDGSWSKIEYGYCDSTDCPIGTYTFKKETFRVGPPQFTYYDGHNRMCYTKTFGFDGREIYTKTEYDVAGRVHRRSDPYFLGDAVKWTSYSYDYFDRIMRVEMPGGVSESYEYNGLQTTHINPLGQHKTTIKSADGRLLEVIDNNGKSMTYSYDPEKNLIGITDSEGNTIIMDHDVYGNRTYMNDPDLGVYEYIYNSFGELKELTYPSGNTVSYSYDILGRLVLQDEAEGTTSYTFDTAANGIGMLASVNSYNAQELFEYDSISRLTSRELVIDNNSYIQGFEFNNLGQLEKMDYPEGFAVKYQYNDLGFMQKVDNANNSINYYTLEEADAYGAITKERYGNNVITINQYDENRRDLLKRTASLSGNILQDLEYTYDVVHNLTTRTNLHRGYTENFIYDNLNRLTSYLIPGVDTTSITYDNLGNITSKSDVGIYHYDGSSPHQLTSIDLNDPACVIPSAITNFEYTSFNKVKRIFNDSLSLELSFGHDRKRVKQEIFKNSVLQERKYYVNGILEVTFDALSNSTKKQFYINGTNGVIGVFNETDQGNFTHYWHKDQLGSLQTVTDENGALVEDLFYDPWGLRRNAGTGAPLDDILSVDPKYERGFTTHEHIDVFSLINMNGRIQDPVLARFVSPDPIMQSLTNMQNMNRYSYVWNNPLRYTDPSGYRTRRNTLFGWDIFGGNLGVREGRHENSSFTDLDGKTISGTLVATDKFRTTKEYQNNLGKHGTKIIGVIGAAIAGYYGGEYAAAAVLITAFSMNFSSSTGYSFSIDFSFPTDVSDHEAKVDFGNSNQFLVNDEGTLGSYDVNGIVTLIYTSSSHGFGNKGTDGGASIFKRYDNGLMTSRASSGYNRNTSNAGLTSAEGGGKFSSGGSSQALETFGRHSNKRFNFPAYKLVEYVDTGVSFIKNFGIAFSTGGIGGITGAMLLSESIENAESELNSTGQFLNYMGANLQIAAAPFITYTATSPEPVSKPVAIGAVSVYTIGATMIATANTFFKKEKNEKNK